MVDLTRFAAVIFDFDGVIVDSETLQARAWTRVARELGADRCEVTAAQIAGRLDAELATELFAGFDAARCLDRKWRIEAEMESAGELRLVDGAAEAVRDLARSHELAICSSCREEVIVRRLDAAGLRSFFRHVIGRIEGMRCKPSPDPYLLALDRLGAQPHDACAIEDSPTGIASAKAAGIHAIQLLHDGMPCATDADEHVTSLSHLKSRRAAIDRRIAT